MRHTQGRLEAEPHVTEVQWALKVECRELEYVAVTSQGNDEANAKRLAECWNAMIGVSDPSSLRSAVDAAKEALEQLRGIRGTQRKRESEEFHIPSHTFMSMWDEADEKAAKALSQLNALEKPQWRIESG